LVLAALARLVAFAHEPTPPPDSPAAAVPASSPLDDLNLPAHFAQLLADRAAIDLYQVKHYQVEPGATPVPNTTFTLRHRPESFVRVVPAQPDGAVLQYRAALPEKFVPLRGFRAPILERADERPAALLPASGLSEAQLKAAACIRQRLARDGLLLTLAQTLQILGPAPFLTNGTAGLAGLAALGFPVDLLACFPLSETVAAKRPALAVVRQAARRLTEGATLASLKAEFDARAFRFPRAHPAFRIATESGEAELGLLRMQAGGGYRNGIVPGSSVDVICQLVDALPRADFLISVPSGVLEPFRWMATRAWRLRRAGQVTLVSEPLRVAAWAQDNGKAGMLASDPAGPRKLATLAPRYACMDEGQSAFHPGESFLMDGLRAAGHVVVHSSLLFQGGNLLAVRDPKSGERILLVGEGELYRNLALGLTRAQVLEAFRAEGDVDRCVVLPAVSYHLDFDVTFRTQEGELRAFVNDTMAAARLILELGIQALQRHGALDATAAQNARADLAAGRDLELVRRLANVVQRPREGRRDFPAALSKCFVADPSDSAAENLQCFLLALDLLQSAVAGADAQPADPERAGYLLALRRMEAARRAQAEALRKLGWTLVAIPSMTDLYRSINYLNGIQHRDGYIMPVFGGFYAPLDEAAAQAVRQVLGPDLKITPVRSADCQRRHGGVHCAAAAYPRW
jgi:hypothetical protein